MSDAKYIIKPASIEEYISVIEETLPMMDSFSHCDHYMAQVRKRLSQAAEAAASAYSHAENSLNQAESALSQEEKRVNDANAMRDSDTEPETVDQSYYDTVAASRNSADAAREEQQRIAAIQDEFDATCADYKETAEDLLGAYQNAVHTIRRYFDQYLFDVEKAKKAMLMVESGSSASEKNVVSAFTACSELTSEQAKLFSENTGKTTEWIFENVRMDADGTYFIKTINYTKEGQTTDNNILFQREDFELNGMKCRGVFPKFVSTFDTVMPEEYYYADGIGGGRNYYQQRKYCVEQLKKAIEQDDSLKALFSPTQQEQIAKGLTPHGFTWEHHVPPGTMQLVWSRQHNPSWGPAGGYAHTGGNAIWCGLPRKKIK